MLDYAKDRKSKLLLKVYQKNTRAVCFYQREGFEIQCEGVDDDTGEKDYAMIWQQIDIAKDIAKMGKGVLRGLTV